MRKKILMLDHVPEKKAEGIPAEHHVKVTNKSFRWYQKVFNRLLQEDTESAPPEKNLKRR
jgi:hypothetical protein